MLDQITQLPAQLLLYEEGYWQQRKPGMSTMNADPDNEQKKVDPDNEQWIQTAWQIRSQAGQIFFRHWDQMVIESWLAEHDYVDTGDGVHYRRKVKKLRKKGEE